MRKSLVRKEVACLFRIILRAIGILAIALFFLLAGVLMLGLSLSLGYLLGLLFSVLFNLPMWLTVTAATIFFAVYFTGLLLGWWQVREPKSNLFPLLVALWLGHKIGSGDKGDSSHK
jgi:hypothetical protein